MAEMGDAFVALNSRLVNMRPDDILRGLEGSIPALQEIRASCPFVGYDQIRQLCFQNPTFGFFFLRLVSHRLFADIERLRAQRNPVATA